MTDFKAYNILKGPGFAETLYLGDRGGRRIVRKISNPDALPFSRLALAREIRLLRDLPDELKPFFPELLETNLEADGDSLSDLPETIYYDMPYYPPEEGWATLSGCLLEGLIDTGTAEKVLGETVDTAFTYFLIDERTPDADYVEKTMFQAIRGSLERASSDPDFRELFSIRNLAINGRPVRNVPELDELFRSGSPLTDVLTPSKDRFLHGDFFPENILYNVKTERWILLDPVSVRGVHRGDFVLDLNKMDDWLSGELPALRMGLFSFSISGSDAELSIHRGTGELENLARSGLSEWYRRRLKEERYGDVFSAEPGWEARWIFAKVFYSFCMLPLAEKRQATARYLLALLSMAEFLETVDV